MNTSGWIQLALYVGALALITKPMGLYLMQVLDAKGRTWFDPVLRFCLFIPSATSQQTTE